MDGGGGAVVDDNENDAVGNWPESSTSTSSRKRPLRRAPKVEDEESTDQCSQMPILKSTSTSMSLKSKSKSGSNSTITEMETFHDPRKSSKRLAHDRHRQRGHQRRNAKIPDDENDDIGQPA